MSRLLDAARSLNQTLDPSRLLVRVCEQARRVAGAERADVFLRGHGEALRLEATYGRPGDAIGAAGEGDRRGGRGAGRGRDRRALAGRAAELGRGAARGARRGVRERARGREPLELLGHLADLSAAAYRNALTHAELALAARTDGLTGCLNHAAMHDTLRRELERCRRTGHGLSLAIVDLDDFKLVNEQHGHQAGDAVLKHVGAALRDSVRAYDVVARYGGDEFAIIALDAGEDAAVDVVARGLGEIRGRLGQLGFGGKATLATAGVAEWREGESADNAHRPRRRGAAAWQARGAAQEPRSGRRRYEA